jgi:hypothetical protein
MAGYCIVEIGAAPETDQVNAILGATCEEWSQLPDKAQKEVVAIEIHSNIVRRYSYNESEALAYKFRHPKIR